MNDNFDRTIDIKMPHTQDKQFKCNFTNNNDHNYLHKKFKKMASTASVSAANHTKENDINYSKENEINGKVLDVTQSATNSSISNGSIAAAHPEIEKIKKHWLDNLKPEKDVQINFSDENSRISELNNINSGQTSNSEEFPSKTDNHDNDFAKDVQNTGPGGRYVCPYCKLSCAKPSVLQKHIRAHTNERPYPCVPCGFAFKTKSNLYKHRRSRTHALRLQGTDVSSTQDDDWSAGSESDTSLPPISISDNSEGKTENYRPSEFSSPELANERMTPPNYGSLVNESNKIKSIYKPKFRAAFYQEQDYKQKKLFSSNADFLNEHISKIISDNEAIVDVIETPLQKKYGKIKQIAESKQLHENIEIKSEFAPLNLTKSCDTDIGFRKRSHSESFSPTNQKHPLNPEGSIIKDLLLKTKSSNGLIPLSSEVIDGATPLYICPLCQIPYRSAENLEIHRTYYCKGNATNLQLVYPTKDVKVIKPENIYIRSHSINAKFPETQSLSKLSSTASPPLRMNKPENLIIKPENSETIPPLPSPGPLLGNTRLVDSRLPSEYARKSESLKSKTMQSPKRRIDSRSESYSPRHADDISPRSLDMYSQAKIRCLEPANFRSLDEFSNNRHNTTSLQMFGGEVKIVDYSGGTTTLRIEPSKSQLSPILIQNMSPSKVCESEASSVVVRSGLHSGGTIVHNLPTPKETTPHSQISRITSATLHTPMHEIPHFQFPPLSAITAFNPLTLPPLSPSASPNGASTIMHGGKLIPHVPGIPGPNTASVVTGTANANVQQKPAFEISNTNVDDLKDYTPMIHLQTKATTISKLDNQTQNMQHQVVNRVQGEVEKNVNSSTVAVPVIKVKNVDDSKPITSNIVKSPYGRQESTQKRSADGSPRVSNTKVDQHNKIFEKTNTTVAEDIRNFNFENLITKAEIFNNQISSSTEVQKNSNAEECPNKNSRNERSETLYFQKNSSTKYGSDERKPKFLRPSTLPLKPGTFTPKRHHGITPNANTMPLVSPETPRPAKAYGQLYLNGNAYTYLGLKCSTKVFYCTINRPQPTYVHNQHFLSMYSNWQLLSEITPDPFGLTASSAMSLYDSRHRPQNITIALIKHDLILTHSSQWKENKVPPALDPRKCDEGKVNLDNPIIPKKELAGGFESNEEYTYVRGRGRGRYVCSECGIRCKKPSMLKKHIRTHTDVRPYTCTHCAFSFKTKGNLTKHMKSKAHYKKCCELGINPNEGNETEGGDNAQGSGETDEDTESDGDEGNEGETESSDTETCKSRLPEHEAAHCLLSLGCSRPTTSATPGLITSARPSTYPYTPTGIDAASLDQNQVIEIRNVTQNSSSDQNKMDVDNEPIDLSKSDVKPAGNVTEIPTAHESSVLASLASNTAKLPQHHNQWSNGEPMLHAYLTERALLDSKIKQSQLSSSLNKIQKMDSDKAVFQDKNNPIKNTPNKQTLTNTTVVTMANSLIVSSSIKDLPTGENTVLTKIPFSKDNSKPTLNNVIAKSEIDTKSSRTTQFESASNTENAKFVVSEYLKHAKVNALNENSQYQNDNSSEIFKSHSEDGLKIDESSNSDTEPLKIPVMNHDLVAQKVVIGAGGVAFKVCSKGKEFEGSPSYTPGKLMEDGRRVCDFCNKTFTKPSQLKIHLNIHYMERPYRCSACAVSFRTRGHLQKHERSGSHHNKVSMTSTFGAATSLNPRPFRCSDCNIAFRIHGHLAKHLRSKMHVMKLECLFKLPFGTFTEIERAGVSLTDIDTTDCASSLASLQLLAQKLHEKDPTKLEYRDPNNASVGSCGGRESSEDEDFNDKSESERDSDARTTINSDNVANETRIIYSATDN